eukprot:XP_014043836.1 PREDICTED: antigen-presenting glycoprotein CD1d2-like [Salmo salar]
MITLQARLFQTQDYCKLNPDGTVHTSVSHGYNRRDFVTFVIPARTWAAAVPQAVHLVEVACHVTGFYPWAVQVEWLGAEGLPMVDGVSSGEVLPNGDGSYQLRKSLTVLQEAQDTQSYSCLVLHSSVAGNITLTWVLKTRSSFWRDRIRGGAVRETSTVTPKSDHGMIQSS